MPTKELCRGDAVRAGLVRAFVVMPEDVTIGLRELRSFDVAPGIESFADGAHDVHHAHARMPRQGGLQEADFKDVRKPLALRDKHAIQVEGSVEAHNLRFDGRKEVREHRKHDVDGHPERLEHFLSEPVLGRGFRIHDPAVRLHERGELVDDVAFDDQIGGQRGETHGIPETVRFRVQRNKGREIDAHSGVGMSISISLSGPCSFMPMSYQA